MASAAAKRAAMLAEIELRKRRKLADEVMRAGGNKAIPPDMTFIQWVDRLTENGLRVDGRPFSLEDRPALRQIYEAIPSTKAEGYNKKWAIIKGAQTGATVMTFLLLLYLVLKYEPIKVGSYYPDRNLAAYVSEKRFLPVVRTVPDAHEAMLGANGGKEGNVLVRTIGHSDVLFLWTSGASFTESFPLGAIVADEVQNMTKEDIERIAERMSASDVRFFFACSTAKWPGEDIDHLYQKGDQRRFHSACRCDGGVVLDEVFPDCVQWNGGEWDAEGAPRDYVYACPACKAWVADPQRGRWVAHNPESQDVSWSLPQTLSPTVSAREIIEAYRTATDMANFFNRKLGKPWTDPSQVPVTLAICERQVEEGRRAGVRWKASASGAVMGLDQMGGFIVAVVLERMADGRQAVIHTEWMYGAETWKRAGELMDAYGVQTCVVEQLPNVDNARAFANRFPGRVWLGTYGGNGGDMMVWSDQTNRSEKRTAEEDRSRHMVGLDQYKAMQAALYRITRGVTLFPEPNALAQDILEKGIKVRKPPLRELFHHFTRVALVVEQDKETRRTKAFVRKIEIDPHGAFAFMLANVAWSRLYGTGSMMLPKPAADVPSPIAKLLPEAIPGRPLPAVLRQALAQSTDPVPGTCSGCVNFDPAASRCAARGFGALPADPACDFYEAKPPIPFDA